MTAPLKKTGQAEQDRLFSTNQLAEDAGVTPRTVRFYESKSLLKPQLAGSTRVYTYRDRARLALILRGKRLGFSLDEIAEYLDLYDADSDQVSQIQHIRLKARERSDNLRARLLDIEAALQELEQIEREATERLTELGVDEQAAQRTIQTTQQTRTPQKGIES